MDDATDVVVANHYVVHGGTAAPLMPIMVAAGPLMPMDNPFDIVVTYCNAVHGSTALVLTAPVARTKGFWSDQTSIVLDFRDLALVDHSWANGAPLPKPAPALPQKRKHSAVLSAVRHIAGL